MHVECPHCQHPIELVESAVLTEVVCPSCGSSFSTNDLETQPYPGPKPPFAKIGRFELKDSLGQGAFGSVWRAKDPDLGRMVAVKVPRPGVMGGPEFEERFLREARAAASLKHEGIVTVHEIGRQDSSIYIVSDLIDGVNLAEWLTGQPRSLTGAEEQARFRHTAELMTQIADALDHAHRQGVVHRDLKPSNIMLDAAGKPHIMDFGLAKREAAELAITRDGRFLGTPAYMSPEQARGQSHAADARSDIWSLGVMLYEILARERPFRGAERMILHQIVQDEPRAPRRLNDLIPRDLETITLKCLAKEPSRRYPSAADLATELRRWLRGEPIHARPISGPERLYRWAKRNPRVAALSAAVAILLLVVAIGSSAAAVIFTHQRDRAVRLAGEKNRLADREREARATAEQNERRAIENGRRAEANAAVAREQSQLALKSLETVIFDIQRKLQNVPGAGDLRRTLLQTALARLQEVTDQFASRSAIDRNTMVALIDLGNVLVRIGAGSVERRGSHASHEEPQAAGSPNRAAFDAACKLYQQASDIAEKLAAADPTNAQAQRDLSISNEKLGDVLLQSGQVTKALESFQKSMEIREKLAANRTDAQARRDLSVSHLKIGDVQYQSGRVTEAIRSYEKYRNITQALLADDPTNTQAMRDLSVSYERLGDGELLSGQVTTALGSYAKGLELSQQLAAAEPTDAQAQRDLSIAYNKLGDVQFETGRITEALRSYEQSLEMSQKLAAADPTDTQALRDLSIANNKVGDAQRQMGQLADALRSYEKCLEIRQAMVAADPTNVQAQRDLSITYNNLGDLQLQSGQVAAALHSDEKALEIGQMLAATDPTDTQAQRDLSVAYEKLGNARLKSGQATEAFQAYEMALEIFQKLAAADPNDAQAQRDLWVTLYKFGEAERAAKQFEKAAVWYEKAAAKVSSLREARQLMPQDRNAPQILEGHIQQCRHAVAALGDWKALLEQPPVLLPALLEMRGTEFVQAVRTTDAVQAVAKLRELKTATAGQLYNAACVYSLAAATIKPPEGEELTAEQTAARQEHIADALATLREAIAAGWKDFAHTQKDPDLAVLRNLPEFKALLPK